MRVAIIGAGVTGLVSCKYGKEAGLDVVVFEQSKTIGGTWVYTEDTKVNGTSVSVHSSMYKNLVTNSPVDVMGFQDFEFPKDGDKSYVSWKDVLNFLEEYVKYFKLRDQIKFQHIVTKVALLDQGRWKVSVRDVKGNQEFTAVFDAVFVCNGHFSTPIHPANIKGLGHFKGPMLHSHEYRDPAMFYGR